MKKDAVAMLGKTLLYIVAVAMTFALIVLAWEEYDWLPSVKDIIRGVVVPMLLGGLTVFLLRHEFDVLKDKWKPFVQFVIFLTGTLVFVNAGIIVQEACAKVMKVDSITTLSNKEIKRTDYLQIESVEPDTSSCNYLFDDAIQPRRGADHINFWFYQVCPLKNKKGVFLCTRAIETHPYRWISEDRLQQWRTDFVNRENGSIKTTALSAHFFKVIHQSDRHYEQYQAVAANCATRYSVTSPEDLVLLQICQPDFIKGWVDNVLYLFGSLLVGFSVLVITLMQTDALNGNFRKS